MNTQLIKNHFDETQYSQSFKAAIDGFCNYCNNIGYSIKGYHGGNVHLFKRLPVKLQRQVLEDFNIYLSVHDQAIRDNVRPDNEAKMLWYAIKKWGYRPKGDLFDKVEEDDCIEVYNDLNIQIHRSFNFYKISSYTIEEVFVNPWTDLYERGPKIEAKIIDIVGKIFNNEIRSTVKTDICNHYLRESKSSQKRVFKASHNYFSPLVDASGRQSAFIVLTKAEISNYNEYRTSRGLLNN